MIVLPASAAAVAAGEGRGGVAPKAAIRPPYNQRIHERRGRMRSLRAFLILPALLLGASACGGPYDTPVQGDHTAERYKTDLEKCRTTSTESVRLKNPDTPQSWVISPFTGPPAVRAAIRTCMAGKGYTLEKTED